MIKSYFLLGEKLILIDDRNEKSEYHLNSDQINKLTTLLTNLKNVDELQRFIDNELYIGTNNSKINLIIETYPTDFKLVNRNQLIMTPYNIFVTDYIIDVISDSILGLNKFKSDSLVNFYRMLMMTKDIHVRNDIFKWFTTGHFSITEKGFIIAYRDVNMKYKQNELLMFATDTISKYILNTKKLENKIIVQKIKNGAYKIVKESKLDLDEQKYVIIGNLIDIYNRELQSTDKQMYTDQYTGKMNIKLLNEVSMDRDECDNNPYNSCSSGLHAKSFNYGSNFGDTNLVMLVAPYDIVAVPIDEPMKFRCCAYTPICKTPVDENGRLIPFDEGTHDLSVFEGRLLLKTLKYLDENISELNVIDTSDISKLQRILTQRIITVQ